MTQRRLRWYVIGVSVYLLAYLGAAAWARYAAPDVYEILVKFVSVGVALPAAVLAGVFQRRNSYLQALRDYWKQLIPAVQAAIQYTYSSEATQVQFANAYVQLSSVIDVTRSVFANVPAKNAPSGLYPFENLKDMLAVLNWLGFGAQLRSEPDRLQARRCMTNLWQETYLALLREFDRDVPVQPVSKYLHTGRSIADLLKAGTLTAEHLGNPLIASHPISKA